jgi:hypothetical protein
LYYPSSQPAFPKEAQFIPTGHLKGFAVAGGQYLPAVQARQLAELVPLRFGL